MLALQDPNYTFSKAKLLFADLLVNHPEFDTDNSPPKPEYAHANFQAFERGLVKIQNYRHGELTVDEAAAVACFLKPVDAQPPAVAPGGAAPAEPRYNYARAAIERQLALRARTEGASPYENTDYVQPTSNMVERLFSAAKIIDSPLRNMKPQSLEMLLMFKINRSYWDYELVASVVPHNTPLGRPMKILQLTKLLFGN